MSFEQRQAKKEKKRKELIKKTKGRLRKSCPADTFCSSGSYILDKSLHRGFAHGRIHEIYAPESSGKTLIATILAAQVNKINYDTGKQDLTYSNPSSVWVGDMENTFDRDWARKWGFDGDSHGNDVDYIKGGDTACDVVSDFIKDDEYSMYVIDCTDQFYPLEVMESDIGLNDIGLRSKTLSRTMRRWLSVIADAEFRHKEEPWKVPIIILLSHGKPEFMKTPPKIISDAGKAVGFYSSIRMRVSQNKINKAGTSEYGIGKMTIVTTKNKVTGAAGHVAEFNVQLAESNDTPVGTIDNVKPIFNDMDDLGILVRLKKGYEVRGEFFEKQGDVKDKMKSDPKFLKEMWELCKDTLGGRLGDGVTVDESQIEDDDYASINDNDVEIENLNLEEEDASN